MVRALMIVAAMLALVAPGGAVKRGDSMRDLAVRAAKAYRLAPALVLAVGEQESEHSTPPERQGDGVGPMQVLPATWAMIGCTGDPDIAKDNYLCGAKYLRNRLDRYDGNLCLAVQAYNSGSAERPCPRKNSYAEKVLLRMQYERMKKTVKRQDPPGE